MKKQVTKNQMASLWAAYRDCTSAIRDTTLEMECYPGRREDLQKELEELKQDRKEAWAAIQDAVVVE